MLVVMLSTYGMHARGNDDGGSGGCIHTCHCSNLLLPSMASNNMYSTFKKWESDQEENANPSEGFTLFRGGRIRSWMIDQFLFSMKQMTSKVISNRKE